MSKAITMESFKARALELNGGIKLAVGRTKGEDERGNSILPIKTIVTLDNYEFSIGNVDGKETEFVAFTLAEDKQHFFFGGSVVTDALSKFSAEEKEFILENGVPVLFEKVKSKVKGHNDYTKIIFFPEEVM